MLRSSCLLAASILVLARPPQDDSRAEALIPYLDGLSDECSLEEFRNRPALFELIALVDRAAPALARAIETSSSASVRASAAYVLAVNHLHDGPASPLKAGWEKLLDDPHPLVRTVAALGASSDQAREMLSAGDIRERARQLPLHIKDGALSWLPETHYAARLSRLLELSRAPLGQAAPTWSALGNSPLAPLATVALRGLQQELQYSSRAHGVARELLTALHTESPEHWDRLGLLFTAAREIPQHRHVGDGLCPDETECFGTLAALADKLAWSAREPYLLNAIIDLLGDLARIGHAPSKELLRKLANDHIDPEAKYLALWTLSSNGDLAAREEIERHKRATRTNGGNPTPPSPVEARSSPQKTAPPRQDPPSATRWGLYWLLAALAVILGVAVVYRWSKTA